MPAALEQVLEIPGAGLGHEVEPLPGVDDSQVGVGIEPVDELFSLVEHVRLHGVIHLVPAIGWLLTDDLGAGSLPECIE